MLTAEQIDKSNLFVFPIVSPEPHCFAKCRVNGEQEGYLIGMYDNKASYISGIKEEDEAKCDKIRDIFNEMVMNWSYGEPTADELAAAFLRSDIKYTKGQWVMASVPVLKGPKLGTEGDPLGQRAHKAFEARLVWVPDVKGKDPINPSDVVTL